MSVAVYAATPYAFKAQQIEDLSQQQAHIQHLILEASRDRDMTLLTHKLQDFMVGHSQFGLSVRQSDDRIFF